MVIVKVSQIFIPAHFAWDPTWWLWELIDCSPPNLPRS